jgi:hypothetical protein
MGVSKESLHANQLAVAPILTIANGAVD